ncbi:MAG: DUF1659 domain-containing protein [Anaerovibrio sp.]
MSTQIVKDSTLKLKLETGVNAKGDVTCSTKSFSGINPGLTDDELLGVADGLAGLQSHALAEVGRVDTSVLSA